MRLIATPYVRRGRIPFWSSLVYKRTPLTPSRRRTMGGYPIAAYTRFAGRRTMQSITARFCVG